MESDGRVVYLEPLPSRRDENKHAKRVINDELPGRIARAPFDHVERSVCAILWREALEWGLERNRDIVLLVAEDRRDVCEGRRGGRADGSMLLGGDVRGQR